MSKAHFEVECLEPEIIKNAVKVDDTHPVHFSIENKTLIIDIEASNLKELMKISYSVCNRVQLAIDTVNNFK